MKQLVLPPVGGIVNLRFLLQTAEPTKLTDSIESINLSRQTLDRMCWLHTYGIISAKKGQHKSNYQLKFLAYIKKECCK